MYSWLRPLLFSLDAEKAHHLSLSLLNYLPRKSVFPPIKGKELNAMGLHFAHPVGLAAGLDKNGSYIKGLSKLGFSFMEIGTVTPKPQSGNPKPRLFRIPEAQAIINRMGFNNKGVDALIENLAVSCYSGILGINIGKNKDTPLNDAIKDYCDCLRKVYFFADYVTVNISSPNTPDLRLLQQEHFFGNFIKSLTEEQKKLEDRFQKKVPLVIKISPDETDEVLKTMANIALKYNLAGIIATNTTCNHAEVQQLPHGQEVGGVSGKPLEKRATDCLKLIKSIVGNDITLIGVGGIRDKESALAKLSAGATLIQIYTGLIYQGPKLVSNLIHELS